MALRLKTEDRKTGPLRYWAVMVEMTRSQGGFTVAEIHGLQNGGALDAIKSYVRGLRALGAIEAVRSEPSIKNRTRNIYRVIDPERPAPILRRPDYSGERGEIARHLWTAIRALRQFSVPELAFTASTEDRLIKLGTARTYVRALARAGYLLRVRSSNPRIGAAALWRLAPNRNTGPRAPSVSTAGAVFDPNLGRAVNVTAQPGVNPDLGRAA